MNKKSTPLLPGFIGRSCFHFQFSIFPLACVPSFIHFSLPKFLSPFLLFFCLHVEKDDDSDEDDEVSYNISYEKYIFMHTVIRTTHRQMQLSTMLLNVDDDGGMMEADSNACES